VALLAGVGGGLIALLVGADDIDAAAAGVIPGYR